MAAHLDHEPKNEVSVEDSTFTHNVQLPTHRRRSTYLDIDNPLRNVEIAPAVKRFVALTSLDDVADLILRGAFLAEDPDDYVNVEGLSGTDRAALKWEYEEKRPWKVLARVPNALRTIIITCSLAAMTQFVVLPCCIPKH
jgi:NADH dehydrogenase/NADH:ubiquinone oxidoreductase subunit G